MEKKPWGIFVPLKIQKIIYPKEKIDIEGPYILATLSRRVSVVVTYYLLNKIKISPNSVSFFGFFVSFFCMFFFINSNYLCGSLLACFWGILDNIDGELARLQKSSSSFGVFLEKLNTNIFYVALFPSLSIGLYRDGLVSFELMILTFFSISFFIILRSFFDANFPYKKSINKNSNLKIIIACQFKNSFNYRKKSKMGSFIFYLWRNIFTQCGIHEILLVLFSLNSALSVIFLPKILFFFSFGYLFINIGILLSLILHNILSK
jgi:phosphatidylglycerophosphate synthase